MFTEHFKARTIKRIEKIDGAFEPTNASAKALLQDFTELCVIADTAERDRRKDAFQLRLLKVENDVMYLKNQQRYAPK